MNLTRRELLFGLPVTVGAAVSAVSAELSSKDAVVQRVLALDSMENNSLLLLAPQGCEDNLRPITRAFQDATGISVQLETVGVDDINTRLTLGSMLGRRIDVALPASFGIPDLVEAQALLPLDEFSRRTSASYDTASLYSFGESYAGKHFGFQTDGDAYLMFYNKRLLTDPVLSNRFSDKFGRAPSPAKTWQELDTLVRFFYQPKMGVYGGSLFRNPNYLAWEFWMRMHAKGQLPFDKDMRPLVTSTRAIEAASELAAITPYLSPTSRTDGLTENWAVFSQGQSLCNLGWGGSQKFFRQRQSPIRDDTLTAGIPGDESRRGEQTISYFNWGWNFTVPRTARNPELSYLFARFAVSSDVSLAAVQAPNGFFDPYQATHYDDPVIQEIYGKEFLAIHRQSLESAIPDLYVRGRNLYFADLNAALQQIDLGSMSPRDAMQQLANRWNQHTDAIGRKEQVRQWRSLLTHYPQWLQPA